jgi:NTE family protein
VAPGRLIRPRPAPEVAFVLPAGGSTGAVQVGIIQALLDCDIVPDVLVGCSVGALNAAYLALNPTAERAAELEDLWRGLQGADVLGSGWPRALARMVWRQDHLFSAEPLRALIRSACPLSDLSELPVPVHVVTTDLDHGVAKWWTRGPVLEILYASACLPGLLPPTMLGGSRHVDGGVLEPVPIRRALDVDARRIFVLGEPFDPHEDAGRGGSALDVLIRSFAISRYSPLPHPASMARPGQVVTVVPGASTRGIPITNFSHTARLITDSRARAREFLHQAPSVLAV